MLRAKLGSELVQWVDGRIDVSPQPLLCLCQRCHDILKRCVPDDQQVDVTGGAELAPGARAEHEGDQHALAEWGESLTEHVGEPGRLGKQFLKLRKDRRFAVSLKVHLSALNRAAQQPRGRQLLEFALHCADRGACGAYDLAKIIGLVGVTEQPAEDAPAGTAEQHRSGVGRASRSHGSCSHNEYNRTQSRNTRSTEDRHCKR